MRATRLWFGCLGVIGFACAGDLAYEAQSLAADDFEVRQVEAVSVNTILTQPGGGTCDDPPSAINLAPASPGDPSTPGTYVTLSGDNIFQAILDRAGINACTSDPTDFCDENPGLLGDPISGQDGNSSGVLQSGGKRATFGFYLDYFQCDQSFEYFALFSYDKVGDECAFEFFLFGPITRGENGTPTRAPLLQGLAINKDGIMLDKVPTTIASQDNFFDGGTPEGEAPTPVTPGISDAGKNCRYCHTTGSTTPDHSQPFPWGVAVIGNDPVPPYQKDEDAPATQPAPAPVPPPASAPATPPAPVAPPAPVPPSTQPSALVHTIR